ncbi:type I restriction-modification enzyme subunit S [Xenorhabdus vietnamensis]|uniref:Type I restriction-modification enzyme subunit S n=1 Tax=Xenorhabdus vietnamensis TaxID=351656 RepID=A0A1Y2SDU4_9GAMM|nr:restriction endonuclease subunit S [Xenorhabdus vietnamensis]OTA16929.1 type I restriction-modification enzyme subunit S [Xenorhabdus vietnamensis]
MVDLMVSEQQSGMAGKGVPVGFKLTEVGVIPKDWECVPFGNLFKTSIKKKNVSDHELVSFIGMQDVSEDAQLKNSIQIPFKEVKSGFTYFEKGDVLLAKITPCFENGKGCHTAELLTNIGFGSTEFHVLRESEDSDSRFIYFWTTDKKFRASLESEMVGSAGHRRVPLVAVKAFLIPCPKNKQEQSAIANTLSDIDDFILASEKLIAKKQAIKIATMQQLLTGKTRLPQFALRDDGSVKGYKKSELGEIPEDWSCINLGELGNCIIGLTYKPEDTSDYGTLVLRSSNIQNNHLAYDDNVFVSIEPPERTIVKEGDILVCVRNGSRQLIGKCALIDKNAQGSAFGAFMSVFRTDIYGFIFHQFQSNVIQKQIAEIMGATINQITNKDMLGFKIPLPESKEEQTAISAILSDMDKDIQTLQQRLDKTRQLKQGMMQELLTGKTRLV